MILSRRRGFVRSRPPTAVRYSQPAAALPYYPSSFILHSASFPLGWALALSLLVHLGILFAASGLRAPAANGADFEQIKVFDVKLVPAETSVEVAVRDQAALPPAQAASITVRPAARVIAPPPAAAEPVRAAVARLPSPATLGRRQPPAPPSPEVRVPQPGTRVIRPLPAAPIPDPVRASVPVPAGGGGGGGGPTDLGPPSARGEAGLPTGGTPAGEASGAGAGRGGGSGSGVGTPGSSGSGSGSGHGSGHGSGQGPGSEQAPAPSPPASPSRPAGRLADQVEPRLTRRIQPDYPPAAEQEGVEGTVRLRVLVNERGRVGQVEVTASSQDRRLDRAAVVAVRQWRYSPAVQDGVPRAVWTHASVTFSLK